MEQTKIETLKITDMVMCGDHPSVPKVDFPMDKAEGDKRPLAVYAKISPTSSRTIGEPRRRGLAADVTTHDPPPNLSTGALVQAALGSFRWPPYLLCVWVLVLMLTHVLHGLVAVLDKLLPTLRSCCQYCREWAEASWREGPPAPRACPLALGLLTAALYAAYFVAHVLHAVAVWAIEPLLAEDEREYERVTDYVDETGSKTAP